MSVVAALEVLELTLPVTAGELKHAYRAVAKRHHPDLTHEADPVLFRTASEAYAVLLPLVPVEDEDVVDEDPEPPPPPPAALGGAAGLPRHLGEREPAECRVSRLGAADWLHAEAPPHHRLNGALHDRREEVFKALNRIAIALEKVAGIETPAKPTAQRLTEEELKDRTFVTMIRR